MNDAELNSSGSPVVIGEPEPVSVAAEESPPSAGAEDRKRLKREKKKVEKDAKAERKVKREAPARLDAVKAAAATFPMVELIEEQVRTSIPEELVARVKSSTKKSMILNENYPYDRCMKSADYEEEVELLQIELVKMQAWVARAKERVIMIFEGRDAAGKGGTIKRFTENLNPRSARIVALAKPTENERGQWYFQRYVQNLPSAGEIAFFDRSWYNRAGVEHVMGFCTPHEYLEFMRQAPEFERMLVRSGIRVFKFWFSVSREVVS